MKPVLLSLLLIINLLMCPLRCHSCDANPTSAEEPRVAACHCCSEHVGAPSPNAPKPCEDGCDCPNCICEGAIVNADVQLSDPVSRYDADLPGLIVRNTPSVVSTAWAWRPVLPTGQLLGGRDVRQSLQSWLL
ncbi:hypothetical protein [Allorhodopirellula solitaria]|uniref:Uncharacterized protein n=1 Tax=Allorhodopirellula solitaria TaxID=2527987 RepID=A0A5C5YK69_9BACT|nr:hypothetical protein [Allorhodopirellula solitaria]TWT75227.1 hypothetical protein CA85_05160 [Allorhodopirellula solitaria]